MAKTQPRESYQIKDLSLEGWMAYSAVLVTHKVVGLSLKPPSMLVDTSTSMWIKKAQLPCCLLYSKQVSHQR